MTSTPGSPSSRSLRPASRGGIALLFTLATCLLAAGVCVVWLAFYLGISLAGRILFSALGVILLLLPGRIAFVSVRRYRREGRWTASDEERLANLANVQTDSAVSRILASPYYDVLWCLISAFCLAAQFRPGHPSLDSYDLILSLLYMLLLAQSVWSLARKV